MDSLNPFSLLSLVGASQGLMLALVLFFQRYGPQMANQILAVFVAIHSVRLFVYFSAYSGVLQHYPGLVMLLNLNIALGPLLYLYVQTLTTPGFKWRQKYFWHFVPVLVGLSLSLMMWSQTSEQALVARWWEGDLPLRRELFGIMMMIVTALYFMAYVMAAARQLSYHRNTIEGLFSNTENIELRWLWVVIVCCLAISLTTIVLQVLQVFASIELGRRQPVALLITTLLIYYLAFMGMRQKLIFTAVERPNAGTITNEEVEQDDLTETPIAQATEKYQRSGLNEQDLENYWQQLQSLMEQEKPYLENGLKLGELATRLGISQDYLSQVINRQGQVNFFDFINRYRVEEARQLLSTEHKSLLHVALDCGFSSQQAFSRLFKKETGMTPTEFKKSLR